MKTKKFVPIEVLIKRVKATPKRKAQSITHQILWLLLNGSKRSSLEPDVLKQ